MLSLTLALMLAPTLPTATVVRAPTPPTFALWPAFPDEASVEGPRPRSEVEAGLAASTAALAACVRERAPHGADVTLSFSIYAVGVVDAVTAFATSRGHAETLDAACVISALRALHFKDRGREPPTRAVIHLAVTLGGARPPHAIMPLDVIDSFANIRDDVVTCRDRELARAPQLAGTVIARFTVAPNGDVVAARTDEGTLANERARACVREQVLRARFDAGRDADVDVAWVFDFPPVTRRVRAGLQSPTLFGCLGISL
jgi:hypothetical protein